MTCRILEQDSQHGLALYCNGSRLEVVDTRTMEILATTDEVEVAVAMLGQESAMRRAGSIERGRETSLAAAARSA